MPSDCSFCAIAADAVAAEVVFEDETTLAFLDHRPLFAGHVLLVPRAHHETIDDLPATEVERFFLNGRRLAVAVRTAMGADGTFMAINNVVSQSVPHLHLHVVPRIRGDGLRGFFWPRHRYAEGEMVAAAERIRAALD